jgi:hypothetical protein
MLSNREAYQRAEQCGIRLTWLRDMQEYRVTLQRWTRKQAEALAYFTDDIEDALLTGMHISRTSAV